MAKNLEETIRYIKSSFLGKMAKFLAGCLTPTELQKYLTSWKVKGFKVDEGGSVPQVMLDCVKGKRLPSKNSQEEIYDKFPELRPWINMPIWDVLGNDQLGPADFEKLLLKIKNNVIFKIILSDNYETYGLDIKSKRLNKTIEKLKLDGSFNALSALTLLLLKAELIKKTTYKYLIKEAIIHVLLVISLRYCLEDEIHHLYDLYRKRFNNLWIKDSGSDSLNMRKLKAEDRRGLWEYSDPKLNYYWHTAFTLYQWAIEMGFYEHKRKLSGLISKLFDLGDEKLSRELDYNNLVYPDYYEILFQLIIDHFKVGKKDEAILRKKHFHSLGE